MVKSTKAITLALIGTASVGLIGTALWVASSNEPTEEEKRQNAANGNQSSTTHRSRGFFFVPWFGGFGGNSGGRSGGAVAPAPSSRGGFGSTGSASVGS